jgi:tetratricopeptide (TPR) repeat protein
MRSQTRQGLLETKLACLTLTLAIGLLSGCGQAGSSVETAPTAPSKPVTFNRDIASIVFKQCSPCHRPTQPGPFNLLTYADAKKRAQEIGEVTSERAMPPWLLEAGYGEFKDERRLSDSEISLIQRWIAEGAVEGNASDLPPQPRWSEGWQLGEPDLVMTIPEPYTLPESGRDVWRTFVIPAPLSTNRYVRAMEFRPGNKCVHHAAMRLDSTPQSRLRDESDAEPGFGGITPPDTARPPAGHMLNWLPGRSGYKSPDGLAWPFEKGADFLVQLHMQTTGKPEVVQPKIGFYFTDQAPTNQLFAFSLMDRTIDIPAGAADYRIRDSYKLPVDVQLLWINPHAHYLAREMKGWARLPDRTLRWLFWIRQWDFNWQGDYSYREPVLLPKGTEVVMEYSYDNSTNNTHNPNNPPQRVQFGQQSTDEMGELWLQVLTLNRRDLAVLKNDFQLKTYAEMTRYYEHRLRLDSKDARAYCRLGVVNYSLGKGAEAAQLFQRAIELDPRDDESHLFLGMTWLDQKRNEAAKSEFETTLRLNPNNYLAHGSLGLLYMSQGELAAAETHLQSALRLNPNDMTAQENLRRVLAANDKVRP